MARALHARACIDGKMKKVLLQLDTATATAYVRHCTEPPSLALVQQFEGMLGATTTRAPLSEKSHLPQL
eukprot:2165124-Prorocentrum_lima.AAC.1